MNPETIKVKVLFFGAAVDITGSREVEADLTTNITAGAAFENILAAYPALRNGFKNSLLLAVNREYANGDEILLDGDELAFIPPVSGG